MGKMAGGELSGCRCSGERTTGGVILPGPGYLFGLVVLGRGKDRIRAAVYDDTGRGGDRVAEVRYPENQTNYAFFLTPIICLNGIRLDLSGAEARAMVYYQKL
ncbi:MAG: hypothetical protein HQK57_08560 [Deltaproteobacteria bacterium]|nr:hypothetical protein [Deltaproteobacteria bacterium]MBF0508962.1 hypothetical protein [Deltaproteobacteria bacterium]